MHVPVLIVGAGPAGLCGSILLSRVGIRSRVVERHSSTSIHPKATDCGIDVDGVVLARPDGHIAWRSVGAAADAAATSEQVVARVLGFGLEEGHAVAAARAAPAGRGCA